MHCNWLCWEFYKNSSALVVRQKKTSLMQYPIIALMRGSHSLSARRAWRTLSSRPEGPQPRSQCNNSYNMYIVMFRCQMEGRVCTVQFFPFLEVLDWWTLTAQSPAPPFPQLLPLLSRQSTPGPAKNLPTVLIPKFPCFFTTFCSFHNNRYVFAVQMSILHCLPCN